MLLGWYVLVAMWTCGTAESATQTQASNTWQLKGASHEFKTMGNLAKVVGDQMLNHTKEFFSWHYGGAIIMDGLHKVNRTFNLDYITTVNQFLNKYKDVSHYTGYQLLHNMSVPFDITIGDGVGLFPINYINRLQFEEDAGQRKTDEAIVEEVVNPFILGWPTHLPGDGTVSRDHGWASGTNDSFVWIDDMFMGLTLPARISRWHSNITLATWALDQALLFNQHLQDPKDKAYFHGYNDYDKKQSCCKWGRGNGWAMMSHLEVLEAAAEIPQLKNSDKFQQLLTILKEHAEALAKYQSEDGRWHQVVDQPSTYLETSSTAMILTSIIKGVRHGFLDREHFRTLLEKGWDGLMKTVDSDGVVNGVCIGTDMLAPLPLSALRGLADESCQSEPNSQTSDQEKSRFSSQGVQTSATEYEERPTSYLEGANGGLGAVLYAAAEMGLWQLGEEGSSQD